MSDGRQLGADIWLHPSFTLLGPAGSVSFSIQRSSASAFVFCTEAAVQLSFNVWVLAQNSSLGLLWRGLLAAFFLKDHIKKATMQSKVLSPDAFCQ